MPREEKKFLSRGELVCQKCPPLPAVKEEKVKEEEDKAMQSEFFDTRQAFLSLCQGNHFQFDSLRRAKHTTMMVLYHLNNPSEPAFVATCNVCSRELEAGAGYRCTKCADFDICEECRRACWSSTPVATPRPRPRRKATNDRRGTSSQTTTNRKNHGFTRPRFLVSQRQVRQPELRQGETTLPTRDEVSNQSGWRMPLVPKNLDVITSPL